VTVEGGGDGAGCAEPAGVSPAVAGAGCDGGEGGALNNAHAESTAAAVRAVSSDRMSIPRMISAPRRSSVHDAPQPLPCAVEQPGG
jgi:hypothetical protein